MRIMESKKELVSVRPNRKVSILTSALISILVGCDAAPNQQPIASSSPEPLVLDNRRPYFSRPDIIQLSEQLRSVTQLRALDLDRDPLSYSILGGPDAELFTLRNDGLLEFRQIPDFEIPADLDRDNSYQLSVLVSDGMATDSMALTIEIKDRLEGRVVDDPIVGAQVFVDLNNNHQLDDHEPSAITDSQGYFILDRTMPENAAGSMLVSMGGINANSNFPVPDLILMARVPETDGAKLVVTPLGTLLSVAQSDTERQQALQQMGINKPVADLLDMDPWNAAIEGQDSALVIQRTNEQLVLLAVVLDCLVSPEANVDAMVLTSQLGQKLLDNLLFDNGSLLDARSLQQILYQAHNELSDQYRSVGLLDPGVLQVISEALAGVNLVFANNEVNPTADLAVALRRIALPALQSAIKDLLVGL